MKSCLIILLFISLINGCDSTTFVSQQPTTKALRGNTMGTTFEIKFGSVPQDCDLNVVSEKINEELKSITRQMSTWEPDSEISQFNNSQSTDWIPVSKDFAFVVSRAKDYFNQTNGMFDITILPLLEIWNIDKSENESLTPPTIEQIKAAQELVNSNLLEVTLDPPALRKLRPEVRIEVSAIAQGHGIDRLCNVLEKFNIMNYMVEIGGELKVKGTKPDGKPWRIAIEKPVSGTRQIEIILAVTYGSVGTSGNYRHYIISTSGKKYSHILNPHTGTPIDHTLVSVSIFSEQSSLDVDALTTSLMVMGPDKGFAWAQSHQLAVIFFEVLPDGQFKTTRTTAFEKLQLVTP